MPAIVVLARYRPDELPALQAYVEAAGLLVHTCDRLADCPPEAAVAIFSTCVPEQSAPDSKLLTNSQSYYQNVVADFRAARPKTPVILVSKLPPAMVIDFLKPKFDGQPVKALDVSPNTLCSPDLVLPFSFLVVQHDDLDAKKDPAQFALAVELLKRLIQ